MKHMCCALSIAVSSFTIITYAGSKICHALSSRSTDWHKKPPFSDFNAILHGEKTLLYDKQKTKVASNTPYISCFLY